MKKTKVKNINIAAIMAIERFELGFIPLTLPLSTTIFNPKARQKKTAARTTATTSTIDHIHIFL